MELQGARQGNTGRAGAPALDREHPCHLPCPSWSSSRLAEAQARRAGSAGPGPAGGDVLWGRGSRFLLLWEPPAHLSPHHLLACPQARNCKSAAVSPDAIIHSGLGPVRGERKPEFLLSVCLFPNRTELNIFKNQYKATSA